MPFTKEKELISQYELKDNQEILFYYDSYVKNSLNQMTLINCRNTFFNCSLDKFIKYKCYECKAIGINTDIPEISIVTHNDSCTRPNNIKKMMTILSNPLKSKIISDTEFNFLPEHHPEFFVVGKCYGYYERPDNVLQEVGTFIKRIDTSCSPHDESPVELYFSKDTLLYEYFEDKNKIKFVEIISE